MSVNKVILVGRLGQDPELTATDGGTSVCNFSIATNRTWKNKEGEKQEETTWHRIVAWGRQAEVIAQYMSKGRQLYIEGRIANRSYEKDGEKKYISEVVVDNFTFIGGKGDDTDRSPGGEATPTPQDGDDDLPF